MGHIVSNMPWALSMGTTQDGFSGHFFRNFEINFVFFIVSMSDLVHDVEAIYSPPLHANSIWKSFLKYE